MSRTKRDNNKGEKTVRDWSKKRPRKTKFFGQTSGMHTKGNEEGITPIKGIHFIKYNWPCPFYPKNLYIKKKEYEPDTHS